MEQVFQTALNWLDAGEEFVLAAICSSHGSTPRGEGAKMLIRKDGSIYATIGGGQLEGTVMERAKTVLKSKVPEVFEFDLTQTDVRTSDAICGGAGSVLISPIGAAARPVFEAVRKAQEERREACFVTRMELDDSGARAEHFCVDQDGVIAATTELDAKLLKSVMDASVGASMHTECQDGLYFYLEAIRFGGIVYLLGGGHVARATAEVAHTAGFPTVVLDDRAEFSNRERFPHSDCIVLNSFDEIPELPIGAEDYIVIMTRGHSFDRVALWWALGTDAGYIGMIGSLTKRDLIYKALEEEGISPERLKQVYSPIGIKLGGRTPGEIAVSIVAELITVRAGK
jgi:xanthine dehydrogenase accessory factor